MKFVPKKLEHTDDVSRGSTNYRSLALAIMAFVGFMISIYFTLGIVIDQMSQRMEDQTEVQLLGVLGDAFPSMDIEDGSESARRLGSAKHVFEQLIAYPKLRDLPFDLRMIDLDVPNAFAIPGGVVAVSPPLFDWVKTDGGLAFVLAHELAHHQKRHVTRRLGRGLLLALLDTLMGAGGGSTVSFGALSQLTLAQYSQEQELEADDFAIEIMNRTMGNTEGALEFLERALQEAGSDEVATFWSSHPPTQTRLDRLKSKVNGRGK
jgi:Zn-dependent protease with chaperone function